MQFLSRYFDAFVEPLFKRDAQGRVVFFFAGQLSAGRIVPDAAAAERLRASARRAYVFAFLVLLPLTVALGLAKGWTGWQSIVGGIAGGAVISTMLVAWLWWMVRGLPRSDVRLSLADARSAQMRALGPAWIKALLVTSIVLTVGAVLSLALDPKANLATGVTGVLLFGWCSIAFWRQWRRLPSTGKA